MCLWGGIRELFSRVHCLHLRHVTHASDRGLTGVVIHYGSMCLGVIVVYGIYNHAMRLLKGVFQGQLRDLSFRLAHHSYHHPCQVSDSISF